MVVTIPAEIMRKAKLTLGDSLYVSWNSLTGTIELVQQDLGKEFENDEDIPEYNPDKLDSIADADKWCEQNPGTDYKDYAIELGKRDRQRREDISLKRTRKMIDHTLDKRGIDFPKSYFEWLTLYPKGDLEDYHLGRRVALGLELHEYYDNPALFSAADKVALDRYNDEEEERNRVYREQRLANN